MRRCVIDRFENGFAVCERDDDSLFNIAAADLPDGAKEGDCLCEDASGLWRVDGDETRRRREDAAKRLSRLFSGGKASQGVVKDLPKRPD